jgi:hypothetical protein
MGYITMKNNFDAEKHEYRIDGRIVPSVTQVIQGVFGSSPWWSEYHAEVGTALHGACHILNSGQEIDPASIDDAIAGRLAGYRKFLKDLNPFVLYAEHQVYSGRNQFAGTIDMILESNSVVTLADIKSSYHPTAKIQLGGYKILLDDAKIKIYNAVIVELHKSGEYKLHWLNSRELALAGNQFLAALSIYNFKKTNNIKD